MILEMFHVKHFCPILPENLTWRETAAALSICKIDRIFGTIPTGRRTRLSWPGPLLEGSSGVRSRLSGVAGAINLAGPKQTPRGGISRFRRSSPERPEHRIGTCRSVVHLIFAQRNRCNCSALSLGAKFLIFARRSILSGLIPPHYIANKNSLSLKKASLR
jgi:hypothetical protein